MSAQRSQRCPSFRIPSRDRCGTVGQSQTRVDRLTLEGQNAEDAFVDAVERLISHQTLQGLHTERELAGSQRGKSLQLPTDTGVLDGHSRLRREGLDRLLVALSELRPSDPLGEVQVAVNTVPNTQRDPEERSHRWVIRGKADRLRIALDPRQPERMDFVDQYPQDPLPHREVADGLALLLGDAVGDEIRKEPVVSEHPQRAVACVGDLHASSTIFWRIDGRDSSGARIIPAWIK